MEHPVATAGAKDPPWLVGTKEAKMAPGHEHYITGKRKTMFQKAPFFQKILPSKNFYCHPVRRYSM